MAVRFSKPMLSIMNSAGTAVSNAGRLFFYVTGTSTKKDTYTTEALSTANSNPVTLDSAGRHGDIWLGSGAYKVVFAGPGSDDPPASPIKTWDPEYGDGGGSGAISLEFDTVALLKAQASASLADGQIVFVSSYYSTGPKFLGGGLFRWDDTSTATQDNVVVFRPDDTGAGVAGRWFRILGNSIAVEDGGVKDDNSTDCGAGIRAVIDAANTHKIQEIVFLGRDTGYYLCSSKIISATSMPEGLTFRGLRPRDFNVGAAGTVIKYTGTSFCWDIRNAKGTDEIGNWVFKDLAFQCSDNAGGMFDLNYLDQDGTDYTATDSAATNSYMSGVAFENCVLYGAGTSSTGTGIRGKKCFYISLDEKCQVQYWKRGIHLKGCDNNELKGRYTSNGRHIMLETSSTFGNDTNAFPAFMGPTDAHGENSYGLYDAAKGTTVFPCLWEQDTDATAQWFMGGAGTTFINPNCGSGAIPVFEIGADLENGKIIGINMRRGSMLAPVVAAPTSWEGDHGAGGEPWYLTIYDAHQYAAAVIGQHPRIRYRGGDPAGVIAPNTDAVAEPWMSTNGFIPRKVIVVNSANFGAQWSTYGGFSGISSMTADTTVPTGHVIRMLSAGTKGFHRSLRVGIDLHNNDYLRLVYRYKNVATVTAGTWRYSIMKGDGTGITNGALTASTTYVQTSVVQQVTGLSDGDIVGIGAYDNGTDNGLDIDSITIAIVEPLTDSTTGTAATTLAAGVGIQTLAFFIDLATLANGDTLTNYTPGYKFKLLSFDFRVHKAATTAAKAATLNLEIGTTNVTGGAIALTSANCTPAGAAVAGSAITAANTGTSSDTLSIEASSVTAFVEGNGWAIIKIQNMDTADAVASLATVLRNHNITN